LHDCGCDANGEVQDPESRFEDLKSQECPRVERADEPEADFCRGEEDADEDEGESSYPSTRIKSAAGQLNSLLQNLAYAHKMPIVRIESVRRNICMIQSGVKTQELQVFRG
jgi:hypothetical protein